MSAIADIQQSADAQRGLTYAPGMAQGQNRWKPATQVVHCGRPPDPGTGALAPPIHLSTSFARDPSGELRGDYLYSRAQNPNRAALEQCMAELEQGAAAACFASGSAAAMAILQTLKVGDEVVYARDLYHGVVSLMATLAERGQLRATAVDFADETALTQALEQRPKFVWCETPANPQLQLIDIARLSERCRGVGSCLVVDNTFATPLLQLPLQLGADLVVHASTKYLGGHGDLTGGVVITPNPDTELWRGLLAQQLHAGAVPSPFDCWLSLRGISTLALRMRSHVTNAHELATRLDTHPKVAEVFYPGLPCHPNHALAGRQMRGPGGMLAISLKTVEAAAQFCSSQSWVAHATSLGAVHTLVEHRHLVEPEGSPVPPELVRISVGIEDVEDIWQSFETAFSNC